MIAAIVVGHNRFWHVIIDHHKSRNLLMPDVRGETPSEEEAPFSSETMYQGRRYLDPNLVLEPVSTFKGTGSLRRRKDSCELANYSRLNLRAPRGTVALHLKSLTSYYGPHSQCHSRIPCPFRFLRSTLCVFQKRCPRSGYNVRSI
jgi:hypothetical protein